MASYKAHFSVDRKQRVVLAVDGSKATEDDMSRVHKLYQDSLFAAGKKPETVVADSHYGGIEALKYYQDQKVERCIKPRIPNNSKGRFRNTEFRVIEEGKVMECPAGHRSQKKIRCLYRVQYCWSKELCNACELKDRCTRSNNGRTVSFYEGNNYFQRAKETVESRRGKKLLRARQIIVEGLIGEAKTLHLLNRCRYRSLEKFRLQLFLTASAINLKRLLKEKQNKVASGAIAMVATAYQAFRTASVVQFRPV
jgi:hypothetical protein